MRRLTQVWTGEDVDSWEDPRFARCVCEFSVEGLAAGRTVEEPT